MPWRLTFPEDERVQFVVEAMHGPTSIAELCRAFGISRKTGYKWLARYTAEGPPGLVDRSRAPLHHPHAVSDEVVARIVALRKRFPTWGPRKLIAWLASHEPRHVLPAASTVGVLLNRLDLVRPRHRRQRVPPRTEPFADTKAPNDTWCVDFKGWFRVGTGARCDPLTMTDAFSRYVLRCEAMTRTRDLDVRPVFESAFREFGLPRRIRHDNGSPFASRGVGGLTRLSVWWVRLGIIPERIQPGSPEENGRHERMHLTLKQDTAQPPRRTLLAQQRAFDEWRRVFNRERPHEALGQRPPASVYEPSPRPFPERTPELEYPSHFERRIIFKDGHFSWLDGTVRFLGSALAGEVVGFEPIADATWRAYFGPVVLGTLKNDLPKIGIVKPSRWPPRTK